MESCKLCGTSLRVASVCVEAVCILPRTLCESLRSTRSMCGSTWIYNFSRNRSIQTCVSLFLVVKLLPWEGDTLPPYTFPRSEVLHRLQLPPHKIFNFYQTLFIFFWLYILDMCTNVVLLFVLYIIILLLYYFIIRHFV